MGESFAESASGAAEQLAAIEVLLHTVTPPAEHSARVHCPGKAHNNQLAADSLQIWTTLTRTALACALVCDRRERQARGANSAKALFILADFSRDC